MNRPEHLRFKEYLIPTMPDTNCAGCTLFVKEPSDCPVEYQRKGYMCPCAVCLMKSICEDTCDEWYAYDHYINKDKPRG